MCSTCKERYDKNPLRILDCKVGICKEKVKNAPKILDFICPDCKAHFDNLQQYLTLVNIPFEVDSGIVRGLDYYTKTVFEFVVSNSVLGAQSTVCGGGRYDNLIESIGQKKIPCVGFGLGIERLLTLLESQNADTLPAESVPKIFIMPQSMGYIGGAIKITDELRKRGIAAETDLTGKSLKSQFKFADKIKAEYGLVLGETEVSSGKAALKNMKTGEQKEVSIKDLYKNLT